MATLVDTLQVFFKLFILCNNNPLMLGRNGHLGIIKYLASRKFNFDIEEQRFDTTALSLAIAMKHFDCARFLTNYCKQKTLDQALISACSEGFIDIVELLLEKGARSFFFDIFF